MSMSGVFEGFVEGAVGGANSALALQANAIAVRQARRAEQAAEEIRSLFDRAAKGGGLRNMDDAWFNQMATAIATTGDYEKAAGFASLRDTLKAERIRNNAQSAWALMSSGLVGDALPALNNVLKGMDWGIELSGAQVGPDGRPVVTTSTGQVIPAEKLAMLTERLMMAPTDAVKYMLDRMKAEAEASRNYAEIAQGAQRTQAYVAQAGAQASQARALASESAIRAALAQQQAPYELARLQALTEQAKAAAETDRALVEPRIAETTARARRETVEADIAERYGGMTAQADAELKRAQAQRALAGDTSPARVEAGSAMDLYKVGLETFERAVRPNGVEPIPDSAMSDFYSPLVANGVQTNLMRRVARGEAGVEALLSAQRDYDAARNALVYNNPELAADPALLASLLNQILLQDEVESGTDEVGEYLIIPLPDGPVKVYRKRADRGDQ